MRRARGLPAAALLAGGLQGETFQPRRCGRDAWVTAEYLDADGGRITAERQGVCGRPAGHVGACEVVR